MNDIRAWRIAGRSVKMKYVYCANFYLLKHFFYFFRFILQQAARWVENLFKKVKKKMNWKKRRLRFLYTELLVLFPSHRGWNERKLKLQKIMINSRFWNGERDVNRVDDGKIIELRWNSWRVSALIHATSPNPLSSAGVVTTARCLDW